MGPLRILVVDDNRDTADSTARLLALWGFDPAVAYDGLSALKAALCHPPDVILLDLRLPGMDGWELALQIRAEPALDGVRLIAITGFGRETDRHRSDAARIDQHLLKPVDPLLLQELLLAYQKRAEKAAGAC